MCRVYDWSISSTLMIPVFYLHVLPSQQAEHVSSSARRVQCTLSELQPNLADPS